MKKYLIPILLGVSFVSLGAEDIDLKAEIEKLKEEVAKLKKAQKKINIKSLKRQIREIKAHDAGDNIKWNVDFRTAYDVIGYERANGDKSWNQILSNRLWLGMAFAPTDNLVFKGLISYYKMYGASANNAQRTGMQGFGKFDTFDWFINEIPRDNELRIKEAYWLYLGDDFLNTGIPWTASFGRRPATDGLLVNYREDQKAKSPIGHIINTEFDGASFKFKLEKLTDIPGMSFKLCMGRGLTNATTRYSDFMDTQNNYIKDLDAKNIDLAGVIFVPYDDGQYSLTTTAFRAFNLIGFEYGFAPGRGGFVTNNFANKIDITNPMGPARPGDAYMFAPKFSTVGDMDGAAVSFIANGIGDGISDFLDDTVFFISYAYSKTRPSGSNKGYYLDPQGNPMDVTGDGVPDQVDIPSHMLGSTDSKSGSSVYVGLNWPCQLMDDARVGIEYNHGSKYWRSFTYAEDTLAGSKLATRGDAYEFWLTKGLIGKKLTAQIRYTYIDNDYTGSQGFFATASGTPMSMDEARAMGLNPIEKAQDIRMYIRYRY